MRLQGSIILVGSASSAHNEPVDATGRDTTSSLYSDHNDFANCNPTRGTVVTQEDGSKVCKCTGDWRNPPTCDEFSYVKVIITILGAVATVVSTAFGTEISERIAELSCVDFDLDLRAGVHQEPQEQEGEQ